MTIRNLRPQIALARKTLHGLEQADRNLRGAGRTAAQTKAGMVKRGPKRRRNKNAATAI